MSRYRQTWGRFDSPNTGVGDPVLTPIPFLSENPIFNCFIDFLSISIKKSKGDSPKTNVKGVNYDQISPASVSNFSEFFTPPVEVEKGGSPTTASAATATTIAPSQRGSFDAGPAGSRGSRGLLIRLSGSDRRDLTVSIYLSL